MRIRIHTSPRQRGQSLVEMSLLIMALLWLLSGAVDFGIGFFYYVAIRDAAQEGALFGSINPTGDIEARVRNSSNAPVDLLLDPNVNVEISPYTACAGHILTVTVAYEYPIIMALTSLITGPTIPLTASATSIILVPPCPP